MRERLEADGGAAPRSAEMRERRWAEARALFREGQGPCRVKLCGMSREEDVAAVNACRPDLVGFVTEFPRSHRSVSAERLAGLAARVDEGMLTVAVMVDLPLDLVCDQIAPRVDVIQLHGHEDEAYLRELRARTDVPVIQALVVRDAADIERARSSSADMVLLDAGRGSGIRFDWSLVSDVRRPFILAGGLEPDVLEEAILAVRPWGVDLSSGIETGRVKDPKKMQAAVAAVRSCNG